mmetsp:Transcript_31885/g.67586  ORF Transcript_31885/g.67586 Transcript_31885/m.67586 type:complete len:228 (-) Transcript_31885:141-824(-)
MKLIPAVLVVSFSWRIRENHLQQRMQGRRSLPSLLHVLGFQNSFVCALPMDVHHYFPFHRRICRHPYHFPQLIQIFVAYSLYKSNPDPDPIFFYYEIDANLDMTIFPRPYPNWTYSKNHNSSYILDMEPIHYSCESKAGASPRNLDTQKEPASKPKLPRFRHRDERPPHLPAAARSYQDLASVHPSSQFRPGVVPRRDRRGRIAMQTTERRRAIVKAMEGGYPGLDH